MLLGLLEAKGDGKEELEVGVEVGEEKGKGKKFRRVLQAWIGRAQARRG